MRFPDGITAQPHALELSAKAVRRALPDLPRPSPESVIALTGIGASEHAARGAAPVWREQGLRAFAVSASELKEGGRAAADVYVALSESGRSTETVAALSHLSGATRLGITNVADCPMAAVVEHLLCLDSGPDSPVYTTGYTASLQALGMLGETWSGQTSDWAAVPDLAQSVLNTATDLIDEVSAAFEAAPIVDVIGSGAHSATAGEGALMLRESARLMTASHETYNYLHGPMEPLGPSVACLVIGDSREVRLAQDVSELGCPTLLITHRTNVTSHGSLIVLTLPTAPSPLATAILQILPLQLLGWAIAAQRGLAVDGFRYHQDDIKLGSVT